MGRIVSVFMMVIVLLSLLNFAEGRLQFTFLPDAKATFASVCSTHTFDLTFAALVLNWKAEVWSTLEASSLKGEVTGYVLDLTPTLCIPISFGDWECQLHITLHYRTSFSNPLDPQLPVIFLHSW
jgi:hypothetical protein